MSCAEMGCFWLILLISLASTLNSVSAYEPNWKSLDTRPLPSWYDEAKFGIFCHWGVFAVPAFKANWFWYYWKGPNPDPEILKFIEKNYKPGFSYGDFGPLFTTEFFNAATFAKIVKSSGAKYFVPTSKHHDGFTQWPSAYSWNWNAVDVGPHRDLIAELREAFVGIGGVHFGLYFSQYEWFNRLYLNDKQANFSSQTYVNDVSYPQMIELVNNYQPDVLWSDGDWEAADTYWNSERFLAWLFTNSSVAKSIVVNDRWGKGVSGQHGSFYSFADHFDPGHIVPHKWENCMTLDKYNWMTSRTMTSADVHTVNELITQLARTISCNGNLLLNIGPTHDGRIIPIFEERLSEVGAWLAINGEAVYKTKPWIHQNDSNVWYTSKLRSAHNKNPYRVFNRQSEQNTIVYAFVLDWPKNGKLILPSIQVTSRTSARMLGYKGNLSVLSSQNGAIIDISQIAFTKLPSLTAWVIKLEYLATEVFNPVSDLIEKGWLTTDSSPLRYSIKTEYQRLDSAN